MLPNAQVFKELVPVTARGEATRNKLLTAAEEEFGSKGFHAASVSSITGRAGVGQGTFYLYFHSKEEVFVTLVRDIGRKLRKQMVGAAGSDGRLEAERRCLQSFLEFTHEHPGLFRIVQEAQFVDEPVFREYYERLAKSYVDSLAAAAGHGESGAASGEAHAWALMGIGHFLGMHWCQWQGRMPEPAVIDEVMNMLSHRLAA